jgi:hypothetical protein
MALSWKSFHAKKALDLTHLQHMLTPEDVFVTDGYPEHTYVAFQAGQKEAELRDGLSQRNKIISISGPSKSGKTTLCDRVFGTDKGVSRIYVTGDAVSKNEDLWLEAYRQITDDTDRPFYECSQTERIEKLIAKDIPLVIDDFHYIPRDVQPRIAQQMKNAASAGLRIICLSVPHRGDDPIRNNTDLAGRFFSVTFDFWTDDDLTEIAATGFPLVGFPSVPDFNGLLAREALKSPQIMQTLCLEACRAQDLDTPLEMAQPSAALLPEIKRRTVRSYNHATALQLLSQGPPTRGSERLEYRLSAGGGADVYECLLEALRQDPPFLHLSLDEVRVRVRNLLVDDKEPNIRSALQQYDALFKDQTPPLDWDDEKRRLTVVDPHFYFYLRSTTRTGPSIPPNRVPEALLPGLEATEEPPSVS